MVLSLVPSAVRGGDNSTKHSCLKSALSHSLHNALHFDINLNVVTAAMACVLDPTSAIIFNGNFSQGIKAMLCYVV